VWIRRGSNVGAGVVLLLPRSPRVQVTGETPETWFFDHTAQRGKLGSVEILKSSGIIAVPPRFRRSESAPL
ncbi:MAG TPA: hypothetical protein VGM27_16670, partial [Acidobacteriaceae bacterium]